MRWKTAVAVSALSASAFVGVSKAAPPDSPECIAAEAALPRRITSGGDAVLYSTTFPATEGLWLQSALNENLGILSGRQASSATLAAFRRAKIESAMTCPNVRALARREGTLINDNSGRERLEKIGISGKTVYLWRMSLPILNAERDEAILGLSSSSNHLGGSIILVSLTKKLGGEWKITGRRVIIMS